jgi:hypothetical protein
VINGAEDLRHVYLSRRESTFACLRRKSERFLTRMRTWSIDNSLLLRRPRSTGEILLHDKMLKNKCQRVLSTISFVALSTLLNINDDEPLRGPQQLNSIKTSLSS